MDAIPQASLAISEDTNQDMDTHALVPASRQVYNIYELLEALLQHTEPRTIGALYWKHRRIRRLMHRSIHLQYLLYAAPEPQISHATVVVHLGVGDTQNFLK